MKHEGIKWDLRIEQTFSDHLKEYTTAMIPGAELLDLTLYSNLFAGTERE